MVLIKLVATNTKTPINLFALKLRLREDMDKGEGLKNGETQLVPQFFKPRLLFMQYYSASNMVTCWAASCIPAVPKTPILFHHWANCAQYTS